MKPKYDVISYFRSILENIKTSRERFLKQGYSEEEIDHALAVLQDLKRRRKLSGEEADVDRYERFDALRNLVNMKVSSPVAGAKLVFEDESWKVYKILTRDASIKLGKESGPPTWCISSPDLKRNAWSGYQKAGWTNVFFMFSKKEPGATSMLAILVDYLKIRFQVWDKHDKRIFDLTRENGLFGVPASVFDFSDIYDKDAFMDFLRNQQNVWDLKDNNGKIDVRGGVFLNDMALTKIPVKFGRIETGGGGYGFYINDNLLTSLEGAPEYVSGNVNVNDNLLTTLEGGPKEVAGFFSCSYNQLKDLRGSPERVGGGFFCVHNLLSSLEGAPEEIGGNFDCTYNNLTSLKGIPKKIGGEIFLGGNLVRFTAEDIRKAQEES